MTSDPVYRATPAVTIDSARVPLQLTDSSSVDNATVTDRALPFLPSAGIVAADCIERTRAQRQPTDSASVDNVLLPALHTPASLPVRQLVTSSSAVNTSMYDRMCPPPMQQAGSEFALPVAFGRTIKPQQLITGLGTANDLSVMAYDRAMQTLTPDAAVVVPPPPIDSERALPEALAVATDRAYLHRQVGNNGLNAVSVSTHDRMPLLTSDMTAAIDRAQIPLSTFMSVSAPACTTPPGLLSALPDTTALYTRPAMFTAVNNTSDMVSNSQFLMMTGNRCDIARPLYSVPSVASTVTAAMPTAVHTINSTLDDACARQASSGAFLTYTSRGPAVAFAINACPGWDSAAMPVGNLNPDPALPTPAVSRRMVSTVNSLSTMSNVLSAVNLQPSLTDTTTATTTTTTTTTAAVTNSVAGSVVDVVPSDLALSVWAWPHVPLVWKFRVQPPPRLPLNRSRRQSRLQFSYPAA